jgi:hypothetical protein
MCAYRKDVKLTSAESKKVRPDENFSSKYAAVHKLVSTLPLTRHCNNIVDIISTRPQLGCHMFRYVTPSES